MNEPSASAPWQPTLLLLTTLYSLTSISAVTLAAVSGLAGLAFADDPANATLPVTCYVIGGAVSTFSISMLMAKVGRRSGFRVGTAFGVSGALLGAWAAQIHSFSLLCTGTFVLGIAAAFSQYYRFAAAEVAPVAFRSRAVSWVMSGGILGAILGPEGSRFTKGLTSEPFVGSFLSLAILASLAFLLLGRLQLAQVAERAAIPVGSWRSLIRRPPLWGAIISAVVGYAVMLFLMTATPIAMHQCHHGYDDTARVIEWHVLGMFVPSFFTGSLIGRFGTRPVIATGALLALACAAINLNGTSVAHFWVALALLGVGWNFMFVGGTTLLTTAISTHEQPLAQGLNESLIYFGNAAASGLAGYLLHTVGWQAMNYAALPFLFLSLIALPFTRGARVDGISSQA
ncbi:MAG TPA: MFS transporter [Polyangiaceae bacterium]|nr:MFS transporter [Polyangiaceae bacterium]